jgi:hypothetical protein
MDFLQKYVYGVFELPLPTWPRNAQKRTKTKSQEKKSRMVGGWVGDLVNVWGGPSKKFPPHRFFFSAFLGVSR